MTAIQSHISDSTEAFGPAEVLSLPDGGQSNIEEAPIETEDTLPPPPVGTVAIAATLQTYGVREDNGTAWVDGVG